MSERYEAKPSAVTMKSADAIKVTVDIESSAGLCLAVVAVYRLHAHSVASFLEELNLSLSKCKDRNLVVVGDMNVCLLKRSLLVDEYLTIMSSFGLEQLIDSPTRVKSCLDHIFFRSRDQFISYSDVLTSF